MTARLKAPALVATTAPGRELAITMPVTASEIAALQAEAENDHEIYETLTVADAADYELADALLSEICRREAGATAMRGSATKPLYAVIKTVEGWFRPYLAELVFAKKSCKDAMGAFRVKQDADARALRELAADAADSGDADGLVESLEAAVEAEQRPAGRASCGFVWIVKRIVLDMLPGYEPRYHDQKFGGPAGPLWVPNRDALDLYAATHSGDDPPLAIPGVVFEKIARIGGRK